MSEYRVEQIGDCYIPQYFYDGKWRHWPSYKNGARHYTTLFEAKRFIYKASLVRKVVKIHEVNL